MGRHSWLQNPLVSNDPRVWDELIAGVEPASLMVIIQTRLGAQMCRHVLAEDILQDALLHAWQDRARCEWRGLKPFRSWLLSIIDNRIREHVDRARAKKRGGGRAPQSLDGLAADSRHAGPPMPACSTTPSRVAMYREQAAAMHDALSALPPELEPVVRLRLFEQMTLDQIAAHLDIGVSAVRHRFRRGAEIYQRRLAQQLATQSGANAQRDATLADRISSPSQ